MADDQQVSLLRDDVLAWNQWRIDHPEVIPDLKQADLRDVDLQGADLSWANLLGQNLSKVSLSKAELMRANLVEANLAGADLSEASLHGAFLVDADLTGANLRGTNLEGANLNDAILTRADLRAAILIEANLAGAHLSHADLTSATLTGTNLSSADLHNACLVEADLSGAIDVPETKLLAAVFSPLIRGADLTRADLTDANLTKANLSGVNLLETNLTGANLAACSVYGISAWNVRLDGAIQTNLRITRQDEPEITVDNLEVAQFLYLMFHYNKLRQVIDTITSKVVLILGRFKPERKMVLDAIREELRRRNYVPVLFDFEGPAERDFTETITLLARMARFIVADLTTPSSVPKELEAIVPTTAAPIQPLIEGKNQPYSMFSDYWKYDWVLDIYRYNSTDELLASLEEKVIAPAEAKVHELRIKRHRMVK